jgi:hypothetical protein
VTDAPFEAAAASTVVKITAYAVGAPSNAVGKTIVPIPVPAAVVILPAQTIFGVTNGTNTLRLFPGPLFAHAPPAPLLIGAVPVVVVAPILTSNKIVKLSVIFKHHKIFLYAIGKNKSVIGKNNYIIFMRRIIHPEINFTNRQRQIIMGTILGGSSLIQPKGGRHCYLSMRSNNCEWVRFKASELVSISTSNLYYEGKTCRWHSICHPALDEFRQLFYVENRRLTVDTLSVLTDLAFGIWFGDCGKLSHGGIELNTSIWGENGTDVIVSYFDLLGYNSQIIRKRNGITIYLDAESSQNFWSLAEPNLPVWFIKH